MNLGSPSPGPGHSVTADMTSGPVFVPLDQATCSARAVWALAVWRPLRSTVLGAMSTHLRERGFRADGAS